ncbi:sulfotransferase [Sulfitobacter sp. TSTF-M16]|uniref:Sulfotransferase n=2 Tax=Sulfitobacter aestuariivivens TaxID=2766981 RepID=A0A927HG67_9RHOB|nr:sulfotransferase [Sulfitobacter aestuariivivens]MBD3665154.1 sulfotransferase [Sulfitobacter aestuariivivens]
MKAGTTWLYAVLARHPQLHFALEKEIHYFYHRYVNSGQLNEAQRKQAVAQRYLKRINPEQSNIDSVRHNLHWICNYLDRPVDDFWYRNLFLMRDHEKYACDFSNLNAHLPQEAWPQISSKCDTLRVLYTMRDPIKRLWSHAKFHLQVTNQLDVLDTWGPRDFDKFVRQNHIWMNAEYGKVLRNLKGGLEPDMLKVIFYEDIHADQRGMLRQIEEFLDVPPFNYPQAIMDRRFTESVKVDMPDFFPGLFTDDIRRINGEIEAQGFAIPDNWTAV